jgi:putative transcriptional regulator
VKVSYKKLWKLLIDKDMLKKDLQSSAGISWASVTKLSKGEPVSMEVLMKVCKSLDCDVGDIMEFVRDDESKNKPERNIANG